MCGYSRGGYNSAGSDGGGVIVVALLAIGFLLFFIIGLSQPNKPNDKIMYSNRKNNEQNSNNIMTKPDTVNEREHKD